MNNGFSDDVLKGFLTEVLEIGKGKYVSASEIGAILYGNDEKAQLMSAINVADACKKSGLANVSTSYEEISLTRKGMEFIGITD